MKFSRAMLTDGFSFKKGSPRGGFDVPTLPRVLFFDVLDGPKTLKSLVYLHHPLSFFVNNYIPCTVWRKLNFLRV